MGAFLTFAVIVALLLSLVGRVLFRGHRDNIVQPVWIGVWIALIQTVRGVNDVILFTMSCIVALAIIEVIGHWFHAFRPHYEIGDGTRIAHATGFSLARLCGRMLVVVGFVATYYLFVATLGWVF